MTVSVRATRHRSGSVHQLALYLLIALTSTVSSAANANTQVRVGLYQNQPKLFLDDQGRPAGIFVDILDAIARQEQWQLQYVSCDWAQCLEALTRAEIDLMPDVAQSPERLRLYSFHQEEVASSWSSLYAPAQLALSRISQLDGLQVATLSGSVQEQLFGQMMEGFGYQVAITGYESFADAFAAVTGGQADAAISNHFFGDYFHQQYGLDKTSIVFDPTSLYFATARDQNLHLLNAIDHHLQRMKREPNSAYYAALARWMERPPTTVIPRALIWLLVSAAIAVALLVLFIALLRWQVASRTRELALANKSLAASEQRFRDLFFNDPAVKLLIDPDSGRIVEANAAASRFYGYPQIELRGMPMAQLQAPASNTDDRQSDPAGLRLYQEARQRCADQSEREVALFESALDVGDRKLLHTIVHDITEHKRLAAELQQARRLEAIGRLAGSVAHDYNNMLSVILGYVENALEKTQPDNALHADLQQVLHAAERSADITRQLLAFARKQRHHPQATELNSMISERQPMLQRLLGNYTGSRAQRPALSCWTLAKAINC